MSKIKQVLIAWCWIVSFGMALGSILDMSFIFARQSPLVGITWLTLGWGSYIGMLISMRYMRE